MAEKELNELADAQLDGVMGGCSSDEYPDSIYDSRGRLIGGWVNNRSRIGYWPCPKCGKPGHKGSLGFHYCDPCNKTWKGGAAYWPGFEDDLVAAGNANL